MAMSGRQMGRLFIGSTERLMPNSTGSLQRKICRAHGCRHLSRVWDTRSLTVTMHLRVKVLLELREPSVYIAALIRLDS